MLIKKAEEDHKPFSDASWYDQDMPFWFEL